MSAVPTPIRELERVLGLVSDASSVIEVRHTVRVPDGGTVDDWRRVDFRIADLRLGSVELLIVASGAVVGAWKGLPALLTFMQGLRDWDVDRRIKESEARKGEAEVRKAEAEATDAEKAATRRRAEQQLSEEARQLLRRVNAVLDDPDVRVVGLLRTRIRTRKAGRVLATVKEEASSDLLRLAGVIESVELE